MSGDYRELHARWQATGDPRLLARLQAIAEELLEGRPDCPRPWWGKLLTEARRRALLIPRCFDCGCVPPDYMVTDEVWEAAGLPYRPWISCLRCLQERLGRALALGDFPLAPVNAGIRFGYEMAEREARRLEKLL